MFFIGIIYCKNNMEEEGDHEIDYDLDCYLQACYHNNIKCINRYLKNKKNNYSDGYIGFYICCGKSFYKTAIYIAKKIPIIVPFLDLSALTYYYNCISGICINEDSCIKQAKWFIKINPTIAIKNFKFRILNTPYDYTKIISIKIAKYILLLKPQKYFLFIKINRMISQKRYNKKQQIAKLL